MEIKKTGGARVGLFNATWPLATLKINQNKLELFTGIMGNFTFSSSDISSIQPYGLIPVIGRGIKINHNIKSYNSKIIFWTFGSPAALIREINETQFFNNKTLPSDDNTREKIIDQQSAGGFPLKPTYAIAIIAIWNILLMIDFVNFFLEGKNGSPLGLGAQLATGFIWVFVMFAEQAGTLLDEFS